MTRAGSAQRRCGHTLVSYTAFIDVTSWKERSNFLRRPDEHCSCTRMYASAPSSSPAATCSHTLSTPAIVLKMEVTFFRCNLTEALMTGVAVVYVEKKSRRSVQMMNADWAALSVRSVTCTRDGGACARPPE